jgi:hypothetical protein
MHSYPVIFAFRLLQSPQIYPRTHMICSHTLFAFRTYILGTFEFLCTFFFVHHHSMYSRVPNSTHSFPPTPRLTGGIFVAPGGKMILEGLRTSLATYILPRLMMLSNPKRRQGRPRSLPTCELRLDHEKQSPRYGFAESGGGRRSANVHMFTAHPAI